jgi:ribosomal protein L24
MVPIHVSNVAYWLEEKKQITKIGFQEIEGKKVRKSRKYNITVK